MAQSQHWQYQKLAEPVLVIPNPVITVDMWYVVSEIPVRNRVRVVHVDVSVEPILVPEFETPSDSWARLPTIPVRRLDPGQRRIEYFAPVYPEPTVDQWYVDRRDIVFRHPPRIAQQQQVAAPILVPEIPVPFDGWIRLPELQRRAPERLAQSQQIVEPTVVPEDPRDHNAWNRLPTIPVRLPVRAIPGIEVFAPTYVEVTADQWFTDRRDLVFRHPPRIAPQQQFSAPILVPEIPVPFADWARNVEFLPRRPRGGWTVPSGTVQPHEIIALAVPEIEHHLPAIVVRRIIVPGLYSPHYFGVDPSVIPTDTVTAILRAIKLRIPNTDKETQQAFRQVEQLFKEVFKRLDDGGL